MKPYRFILTVLIGCSVCINGFAKSESLVLEGPYLGQKPPGMVPEQFAPGLISGEHRDRAISFSPDLKEFYFSRRNMETGKWWLVIFKSENNQWSESVVMPRVGRPQLSPDGVVMHMGKKFMERTDSGWSPIRSHGPDFEAIRIMRLVASQKGTFIFDEVGSRDGDGVLRYSTLIDGKRQAPRIFGKHINTGKFNAHPFIAPDESYFIFDGERDSGFGETDLYISFRKHDGTWGTAVNMGPKVNTVLGEAGAHVTPDGKYLFFNSSRVPGNGGIFWMDARIIDELRQQYH